MATGSGNGSPSVANINYTFPVPVSAKAIKIAISSPSWAVSVGDIAAYGLKNNAPSVTITSPASGSVATPQSIPITVTTSDPDAGDSIAMTALYDNGVLYATNSTAPFTINWNTKSGTHNLVVLSYDSFGKAGTSQTITRTVSYGASANVALYTTGGTISEFGNNAFDGNYATVGYGGATPCTRTFSVNKTLYEIVGWAWSNSGGIMGWTLFYSTDGTNFIQILYGVSNGKGGSANISYAFPTPTVAKAIRVTLDSPGWGTNIGDIIVYGQ